ncbi:MAG: LptF/LptG family permease [Phycisphaeraceae bacterium]|nr:LptF/LptG family permease [Phycisphaerae bacterium]MBX3392681.1 LptF/LptG family permease [Phycisphaeraceae bacterium]HRJ50548.1 LptF/LptG family permease [Phycisphaerales bacterium]
MTLFDRHIARQYLINVVVLLAILCSFVVTIDMSVNFNRMVGRADQLLREHGASDPSLLRRGAATFLLVADLWWPRLLQLFNFTLGLVMVGAMGFTFSQMVRGRELVAMLAGGVSLHRAAVPVVACSLGLTLVQAVNQEMIVPRVAGLLTRDHGDAGKRDLGTTDLALMADGAGRLFHARVFNADDGTIHDLLVIERDREGKAIRRISAVFARWRDGGWDLDISPGSEGVVGTGGVVDRIVTDLDPVTITMRRFAGFSQSLSFTQITGLLRQMPESDTSGRDRLERFRWGRFAVMAANIMALVACMHFFLRREPTNMLMQAVKGAPVAVVTLMGGVLGATAEIPGIPPQLGVMIPVLIITPFAIASASMIKT